jgi:hypothetical protein
MIHKEQAASIGAQLGRLLATRAFTELDSARPAQ